jgi:hypothetical protein
VTAGAGNDSLVDSPTRYGTDTGAGGEVRGNYATLNPLNVIAGSAPTNGNLDQTGTGARARSTIWFSSGKYYAEFVHTAIGSAAREIIVFAPESSTYVGYRNNGQKNLNGSLTSYGASWTTNDVIGIAVDADSNTVEFFKNGASQGQISHTITGLRQIQCSVGGAEGTDTYSVNFGQRPFSYTAPSGFKALVTTNLPAPTIEDGGEYFNAVLYTGNSSGASVTGVGFQPDFVWMKCRSTARNHELLDVVRGGSSTLFSNLTNAQATDQRISSFNADGFTYTTNSNSANTGDTFVAWNWKANGAGVSNTAGTITSTVSVNTTSGFSIVTATCASGTNSYGHGLGAKPAMYIVKNREASQNWQIWHQGLSNETTAYLQFNTSAQQTFSTMWAASTSTTISLVSGGPVPAGDDFVAYVFAPVAGYSAFGSYTGNGSADGPFVFTGFRPRYVLIKDITNAGGFWNIRDTARNEYNQAAAALWANVSDAENSSGSAIDILSNGFKVRATGFSANSATYIYACFAENPFAYSLAR